MTTLIVSLCIGGLAISVLLAWAICARSGQISRMDEERERAAAQGAEE